MKSMTIHGIDDQLAELIKSKANQEGLSINKTIKKLLETSLGIRPRPPQKNIDEFSEFCGVWDGRDLREFEEAISDTETVDPGDWQ
jgi:DNA polymerase III delta subunit